MKELIVKATVLDEICIAKRQEAGNEYETLDFIPGRILWGAFASLAGIHPGQKPPDDFITLFYSGDVIFSNLYPSDNEEARSNPVPISALAHKHTPGFEKDRRDYRPDGILDCLIRGIPPKVRQNPEMYVKYKGYYAGYYRKTPPDYTTVCPKTNYIGRHERDIHRGTSKEGMLFTRQNIPRGEIFLGFLRSNTVEGDSALDAFIKKNELMTGIEVSVGRSPGRVKIEVFQPDAPLHALDYDLPESNGVYNDCFTITFLSPAILLDSFLRPLNYLPAAFVKKELPPVIKSCDLLNHFSATELIQGWNGAYRRPMETDVAITAGSAFFYRYTLAENHTHVDMVKALNNFRRKGIGVRRSEGFGEIRINDPFHTGLSCFVEDGHGE